MENKNEVEMFVVGLVLDPGTNAPIVILKDATGKICLPIWIGLAEATSIASALKKVELTRPMTHDLLRNVVDQMGGKILRVIVSGLDENTFLASIELTVGDTVKIIDSRPSDAIALAVRVNAPILVSSEVLAHAQVTLVTMSPQDVEAGEGDGGVSDAADVLGDKNFANIEKDKWADILAEMDPEDFKYKM